MRGWDQTAAHTAAHVAAHTETCRRQTRLLGKEGYTVNEQIEVST